MSIQVDPTLSKLDTELVSAAKAIKVLSVLSWSRDAQSTFLDHWTKGNPVLPEIKYEKMCFTDTRNRLTALCDQLTGTDPIREFLRRTAKSYIAASRMLENVGTAQFVQLSKQIYGQPGSQVHGSEVTYLEYADHILDKTLHFQSACRNEDQKYCISPQTLRDLLQDRVDRVFTHHPVEVVVDDNLSSKAAAGATRVRIRSGTCFSEADVDQLTEHECFVHTLTALNGRCQPHLKALSLGAPRTTRTQEGLALFAELATRSIDLARLRRVALRVRAIQMALDGADFLQVFEYFLEGDDNPQEAFQSAARVFRGGDVKGTVAFTKDCVYLGGLVEVHTFLLKTVQQNKADYPHFLVSGRVALSDIPLLENSFRAGILVMPKYEPEWILKRHQLAAFLLHSAFLDAVDLSSIELETFDTGT